MYYVKLTFLFFVFFMAFGSSSSQAAGDPAAGPGTVVYKLGDVEIIAVRDQISKRSRDLLLGDAKRIVELMPEAETVGSVNAYVVKTKKSITLIDTGWGAPRGQVLDNLKQIGITPDQINTILFTHLHGDHVSGLLREGKTVFPNAELYVPAGERAYWFNDDEMNNTINKIGFTIARQGILAYGDRVRVFESGTEVVPGITVINESGHTPGHVGYLVKANNKKILIWGDLTHFTEVQLAAPEIAVRFDVDPKQAIASRQAILAWVARENMPVAGMHILYPGVGRVHAQGTNSYVFEPLDKLD
ncbi:MAG: metallo-beta-lactamase superfamily protein [Anaerosporomusa subterranea]|jgi:glyoxylase-like metal-dependent hydrolase (beta-lactamase superfamily II)|nr:metallo-beta-lactamase superfamily protein [Anaerosporomusa subterranea]